MATTAKIQPIPRVLIPKPFANLGYWSKEYDGHVVSIGYKDKEFAVFTITEETTDAALDAIIRHFIRMVSPIGVV